MSRLVPTDPASTSKLARRAAELGVETEDRRLNGIGFWSQGLSEGEVIEHYAKRVAAGAVVAALDVLEKAGVVITDAQSASALQDLDTRLSEYQPRKTGE